jgi:hypothetical protein
VDLYLYRRYAPADLALSGIVTDWAATLGAYYLCLRRGNLPAGGISIMYENAIAEMIEVKKGLNEIPGIPARKSYVPVYSSMRATMRPFNRAVVEVSRGSMATGMAANYHQHKDAWDTFGVNTNALLDLAF